jgi:MSHA biogenesis protein MshM
MDVAAITQACESHYGLNDAPFSLTPDTGFYVQLESHQQVYESVLFGLGAGEGFIKVTGEVGTGKTLLCRRLLNHLSSQSCPTAYIPNPTLSPTALWVAIGAEIGLGGYARLSELRNDIQRYLVNLARNKQRLVLVIDEAQSLPSDTLESLRLISNLETERQKLIQIVLFGQPELDEILNRQAFRQLKQRITTSARLNALEHVDAVGHYLNQRLSCAGYRGAPLFTRKAVQKLWQLSQGTPRIVNVLAGKALLAAFGQSSPVVGISHIDAAAQDTESAFHPTRWQDRLKQAMGL